jgi:hypothetical protein
MLIAYLRIQRLQTACEINCKKKKEKQKAWNCCDFHWHKRLNKKFIKGGEEHDD